MKTRFKLSAASFAIAAIVLGAAPAANAHDIVLVPEADALRVRYGHPQDWQPVSIDKLVDLRIHGAEGSDAPDRHDVLSRSGIDLVAAKDKLGAPPGAWLAAARYDNGLWVELAPAVDGAATYRNASRVLVPEARSSILSLKFAKAYAGDKADASIYKRNAGHALEIVPIDNPLAIAPGELLAVRVLLNGEPLAGAGVEVGNMVDKLPEDKIVRYPTDEQGVARVPLRAEGLHMLGVDLERRNDGSALAAAKSLPANKVTMIATYTFVR